MFKLDNDFLQSLGLGGLPVDEKNRLLQMIYERLEMNVGMRLAEKMTDQQLDEFEGFIDRNDEAGALKWLETNFPNYKDVVAEELEKLKVEVQTAAPQILAAHNGNGQPMPAIAQEPIMPGVTPPQQQYAQAPPAQQQYQQPAPQQYAPQPAPAYSPQPQMPQYPSAMPQQPLQQPIQPAPQPQYAQAPQQQYQQPAYQPQPMQQQSQYQPQPAPTQQTTPAPVQQPQQFTPPPPGFTAQ